MNINRLRVVRPKDTVEVLLLKHKISGEYSFVNLTKGHICPCKFKSVEEALKDLNNYIKKGKVLSYEFLEKEQ